MKPFLDLRHIAIDATLVQDLPPALAHYYEALPIAREGDSVTVAMSHPENVTALAVLTQLFRAEIVPIRTDGAAVRAALQHLYAREATPPHSLVAWLPATNQSQWSPLLSAMKLATGDKPVTWLDAEKVDGETFLATAHAGNYELALCTLPEVTERATLLRDIHIPLWLVPAVPPQSTPRRILLVLRGFASDEVSLSWALRLAQSTENVTVALLPLMGCAPWGALAYLQQPGAAQGRVTECALRLAEVGIQPLLTLQSGEPRQQVIQAMRQEAYDLVVIAAEGHGQFVGQLLTDLEEKCTLPLGGVLVLKPSHEHAQRLTYTLASAGTLS